MRDILNEAAQGRADPVGASQAAMKTPLPRRFYKEAAACPSQSGFGVHLDGRPVRTPARNALELPTLAAAQLVADEFAEQKEHVDPAAMPVTRLANTVIDGVAPDPQPVFEDLLRFVSSDLLCYRAPSPRELAERQARLWDPMIDWQRDEIGANFVLAEGVMHVAQPKEAIAAFATRLRAFADPFALAALHSITTLTGSAILALAVAEERLGAKAAWEAAHVDEDWNIAQWGEDAEAQARREARGRDMDAAAALLAALRSK